jgi:hypothetical protein
MISLTEQLTKFVLINFVLEMQKSLETGGHQKFNSRVINFAWFILVASVLLIVVSFYFVRKNHEISSSQSLLLEQLSVIKGEIRSIAKNISLIIDSEEISSLTNKSESKDRIKQLQINIENLDQDKFIRGIDPERVAHLRTVIDRLEKMQASLDGISNLVLNQSKGVNENKRVIRSQLLNTSTEYVILLSELDRWSLHQMKVSSDFLFKVQWMSTGVFSMLALLGFLFIIRPLRQNFQESEMMVSKWEGDLVHKEESVKAAIQNEKESTMLLKAKVAQVRKLQESLEIAINTANKVKQDKNLVYYNAATDISGYLKVLNLQREILENQTNIGQNLSWTTLTSSISQLNSMVGDYFQRSKNGFNSQNHKETYLSQLVSEILLSIPDNENLVFEQVTDMPTIKTNIELFKRMLQPYFELISRVEMEGKVSISAIENGTACEIKFMGLTNKFKSEMNLIESKDLSNLDFEEFKIHMSSNAISERGGRQWMQFDLGETGVFNIHWVL